ncbi:ethanolamine utilization protein EutN [Ruegeria atlantica]|uniref:Ethanolamine utilization protein EutN n=1 Tax=Ruegeria atlantica TaxID=81569 RepID=A0AA91BME3_9RHOB|nr:MULTISPECIES: EutN/CcmL family microcompartment protein [Ruegeria]NOC81886.1 ethanolamine utilization protein EutN [Ruegeria sp. HKCCD6428]NOC92939.1 ethanolamine utilization protein EutN [Ruegeria sp. HKCCD6604]NOD29985.1 ethanolamine utilization protein EutN [Ruegeria atlantica]NOE17635.1 ethanolamine utilization protein EutN [Ruegeria atlantica]
MHLGKVAGTVTATAKDARLVGAKLLVTDLVDSKGSLIDPARVAVDTCGAGVGDTVLVVSGSAARMAAGLSTTPVDMAIIAVIDRVSTT